MRNGAGVVQAMDGNTMAIRMNAINLKPMKQSPRFGILSWDAKASAMLQDALKNQKLFIHDVDTQDDFMRVHPDNPRKGLYVPQAETIIPKLKQAVDRLRMTLLPNNPFKIPHFRSKDTHQPGDPEFEDFKAFSDEHCIENTPGWQNIPETELSSDVHVVSVDPQQDDVPDRAAFENLVKRGATIEIRKNRFNLFEYNQPQGIDPATGKTTFQVVPNQKALKLFDMVKQTGRNIALVYGVCTDICVKQAIKGFKAMDITPIVVSDAIYGLDNSCLTNPADPEYRDIYAVTSDQLAQELTQAGLPLSPKGIKA